MKILKNVGRPLVIRGWLVFLGLCACLVFFAFSAKAQVQTRTIPRTLLRSRTPKIASSMGLSNAPTSLNIAINSRQFLVDRIEGQQATKERIPGGISYKLPYKIYGITPQGANMDIDIAVDIIGGGMVLTQDGRSFLGHLEIRLVDSNNPESIDLTGNSVRLELLPNFGSIEGGMNNLAINHTNLPSTRVNVVNPRPTPVELRINSSISHETDMVILDVASELDLSTSLPNIDGLGIGTAVIIVQMNSLSSYRGIGINLITSKGMLDSNLLTFDDQNRASAKIRSVGVGKAIITATSGVALAKTKEITFLVPWVFILCTLLGGLAGAAIKLFMAKAKKLGIIVRRLARGVLVAVVVTFAYAVGVKLITIMPEAIGGEALTFVLAAVGSYIGKINIPGESKEKKENDQ